MVKIHHETITFGTSSNVVSRAATTLLASHVGPTGGNDTMARTVHSFGMGLSIDPSGNPPPREWWHTSRVVVAVVWDPTGSGTLPSSENSSSIVARWVVPPLEYGDLTTNALYGVSFQTRSDVLQTLTRRKGNGTNTPKVLFGLYLHDANGALQNPGGLYSVNSSFVTYSKVIWESDT